MSHTETTFTMSAGGGRKGAGRSDTADAIIISVARRRGFSTAEKRFGSQVTSWPPSVGWQESPLRPRGSVASSSRGQDDLGQCEQGSWRVLVRLSAAGGSRSRQFLAYNVCFQQLEKVRMFSSKYSSWRQEDVQSPFKKMFWGLETSVEKTKNKKKDRLLRWWLSGDDHVTRLLMESDVFSCEFDPF